MTDTLAERFRTAITLGLIKGSPILHEAAAALDKLVSVGTTVYVLSGKDDEDTVEAIHATKEGAEAHRQRFVMPSWLEVEEVTLEP